MNTEGLFAAAPGYQHPLQQQVFLGMGPICTSRRATRLADSADGAFVGKLGVGCRGLEA